MAAAGNESTSKREAEATEGTAATAGKTVATEAAAAPMAAALDEEVEKRQAIASEGSAAREDQETNEQDERIRDLIQSRKTTAKHEKDQIREQRNQKENQRKQEEETGKIQKILEKVKGTKNIPSIKSVKRRILIPKVRNKDGEAGKTRQGIANVFAKFFEDLYKGEDDHDDEDMSSCIDHENVDSSQIDTIPEFTTEEIQAAINRLEKGKAKDSNGVRADTKICSEDKGKDPNHLQ